MPTTTAAKGKQPQVATRVLNPSVIAFLGTDTKYTPTPNTDYPHCETNSLLLSIIDGEDRDLFTVAEEGTGKAPASKRPNPSVVKVHNENATLIEGPDTAGTLVGDRMALGAIAILKAMQNDKSPIIILAHSRGAVQAILVLDALDKLKALKNPTDTQILECFCPYTQAAFLKNKHYATELLTAFRALRPEQLNQKPICSLIDPVPGGNFMGIPSGWFNKAFLKIKNLKEGILFICKHEFTRCFDAILPEVDDEVNLELMAALGHHGTGTGNIDKDQQKNPIDQTLGTTSDMQRYILLRNLDLYKRNGVPTKDSEQFDIIDPELRDFLNNRYTYQPAKGEPEVKYYPVNSPEYWKRYDALYLKYCNAMSKNYAAYAFFKNTSYAFLGQQERFNVFKRHARVLIVPSKDGNKAENAYLKDRMMFLPPPYLTVKHAQLDLKAKLGLENEDLSLPEIMFTTLSHLESTCKFLQNIKPNSKQSTIRTELDKEAVPPLAKILIKDDEKGKINVPGLTTALGGLRSIMQSVAKGYSNGELAKDSARGELYEQMKATYKMLESLKGEANMAQIFAGRVYALINEEVIKTLDEKHTRFMNYSQSTNSELTKKCLGNFERFVLLEKLVNIANNSANESAVALIETLKKDKSGNIKNWMDLVATVDHTATKEEMLKILTPLANAENPKNMVALDALEDTIWNLLNENNAILAAEEALAEHDVTGEDTILAGQAAEQKILNDKAATDQINITLAALGANLETLKPGDISQLPLEHWKNELEYLRSWDNAAKTNDSQSDKTAKYIAALEEALNKLAETHDPKKAITFYLKDVINNHESIKDFNRNIDDFRFFNINEKFNFTAKRDALIGQQAELLQSIGKYIAENQLSLAEIEQTMQDFLTDDNKALFNIIKACAINAGAIDPNETLQRQLEAFIEELQYRLYDPLEQKCSALITNNLLPETQKHLDFLNKDKVKNTEKITIIEQIIDNLQNQDRPSQQVEAFDKALADNHNTLAADGGEGWGIYLAKICAFLVLFVGTGVIPGLIYVACQYKNDAPVIQRVPEAQRFFKHCEQISKPLLDELAAKETEAPSAA